MVKVQRKAALSVIPGSHLTGISVKKRLHNIPFDSAECFWREPCLLGFRINKSPTQGLSKARYHQLMSSRIDYILFPKND